MFAAIFLVCCVYFVCDCVIYLTDGEWVRKKRLFKGLDFVKSAFFGVVIYFLFVWINTVVSHFVFDFVSLDNESILSDLITAKVTNGNLANDLEETRLELHNLKLKIQARWVICTVFHIVVLVCFDNGINLCHNLSHLYLHMIIVLGRFECECILELKF